MRARSRFLRGGCLAGIWISMIFGGIALAQQAPLVLTPEMEEMLRWQIRLDRAKFGPGKLDGKNGQFTKTARALYEKEHPSQAAAAQPDPAAEPVLIKYIITKEDGALVGRFPGALVEQSKLEWLPYGTLSEAIAEKFHCDEKFFQSLNADKIATLKEGDEVLVPNVEPFSPEIVKSLTPGSDFAQADSAPVVRVRMSSSMLEVLQDGRIQAAFPVTIGSTETKTTKGNWVIKGMERFPKFRHDKKMLNEGERSSDYVMIPSGPNNPVGVLWIELNKKGLGIHGTEQPDTIGRSASHGCIRLANWDIVRLATMVKGGVEVVIE